MQGRAGQRVSKWTQHYAGNVKNKISKMVERSTLTDTDLVVKVYMT